MTSASRLSPKTEVPQARKGRDGACRLITLVTAGFMDLEASGVETFSVAARRSSRRLLASAAACRK
eukprot:9266430-Pyramimonas_sp.AAC.1